MNLCVGRFVFELEILLCLFRFFEVIFCVNLFNDSFIKGNVRYNVFIKYGKMCIFCKLVWIKFKVESDVSNKKN